MVTSLIAGTAILASPAYATPPPPKGPELHASSGCPGDLKTVVPDSDQLAKDGINAVLAAAGKHALSTNVQVPQRLKKILASDPHWVSEIQCGKQTPLLDPGLSTTTAAGVSGATSPLTSTTTSKNWSGYEINGIDYENHQFISQVQGSWSVPFTDPPNTGTNQESASEWVGIGSGDQATWGNWDQLIQVGTVAYTGPGVLGVGARGTYGFYEMYPYQNEVMISNYPVNSGDAESALVVYDINDNAMIWVLCSQSASSCVSGTESFGTDKGTLATQGEWILERHGYAGHISQLLPFGITPFVADQYYEVENDMTTADQYTLGQGPSGTQSEVKLEKITMTDCSGSPNLATVGALDSTGDFSITAQGVGTTC